MKVSFELPVETVRKLVQGDFYKVQLAYYQLNQDGIGHHRMCYCWLHIM